MHEMYFDLGKMSDDKADLIEGAICILIAIAAILIAAIPVPRPPGPGGYMCPVRSHGRIQAERQRQPGILYIEMYERCGCQVII